MIDCEQVKNFEFDFTITSSKFERSTRMNLSCVDMSATVIIKVCFEIGCGRDIKDKHFGCVSADIRMTWLWKILIIHVIIRLFQRIIKIRYMRLVSR